NEVFSGNNLYEFIIEKYKTFTLALCLNKYYNLGHSYPQIDINRCFKFHPTINIIFELPFVEFIDKIKSEIIDSEWDTVEKKIASKINSNMDWLNLIPGKYVLS